MGPLKSRLTVDDCYDLGKVAYSEADYFHTELWMSQALQQLEGGEEPASAAADAVTILDYLSYSIYQQGELERALEYTRQLLRLGGWLGQMHAGKLYVVSGLLLPTFKKKK